MANIVPWILNNSLQKLLMYMGSWLEMIFERMLWSWTVSWTKISTTWGVVKLGPSVEKCPCLVRQSTTTDIVVFPSDGDKCVMKSTDTGSHILPKIGSGWSCPWGVRLNGLIIWQVWHFATKCWTNFRSPGQRTPLLTALVFVEPSMSPFGELWNLAKT